MEASYFTVTGENADRLASALIETKAEERRRSINKRGVRNIHTFEADDVTQVVWEQGSSYSQAWLMVSILVELEEEDTARVVVFVGGGGQGPFKLEEVSLRRLLKGEGSVGESGRFATVLRDVDRVCESLDLEVETQWETEGDLTMTEKLERKIFHS